MYQNQAATTSANRFVFDRGALIALASVLVVTYLLLFATGFVTGSVAMKTSILEGRQAQGHNPQESPQVQGRSTTATSQVELGYVGLEAAPANGDGGGTTLPSHTPQTQTATLSEQRNPADSALETSAETTSEVADPNAAWLAEGRRLRSSQRRGFAPRYSALIRQASSQAGLSADLVSAIIEVESSFNPRAISPRGALGLMQVMPNTALRFDVDPDQLFDPEINVTAGTRYLKWLDARFRGDLELMLAAYNAGSGAVERYDGIPPYPETQKYVRRVFDRLDSAELLRYASVGGGD